MRCFVLTFLTLLLAHLWQPLLSKPLDVDLPPSMKGSVVVERVGPGSNLEKAGLQKGDRLFSWRRLPNPPANPEGANGPFESLFDWKFLVVDQAPRGVIELTGESAGERRVFTIPMGSWESEVRPWLPAKVRPKYRKGRELIEAKELDQAEETWLELKNSLGETRDWRLRCGLSLRMGEVWAEAQEWERARTEYELALELAEDWRSRAEIWPRIGVNLQSQSLFREAAEAFQMALEIQEKEAPSSLGVARSLLQLGNGAGIQGDLRKANEYYQQAVAIVERAAPNSLEVAKGLDGQGWSARNSGDLDSAAEYHRRALEIRKELAPNSLEVVQSLHSLLLVLVARGDLATATEYAQQALAITEKLAPNSLKVAQSLEFLALVAFRTGDLVEAAKLVQKTLATREKLAPDSIDVAQSLDLMGSILLNQGNLIGATEFHNRALAIYQQLNPNGLLVARCLWRLGVATSLSSDPVAAQEYYRRALAIQEKLAPNSLYVALSLSNLGAEARNLGDMVAATEYTERALAIQRRLAPDSLDLARSLRLMGEVASHRGDLDEASEAYHEALAIHESLAPENLEHALNLGSLGGLEWSRGDLVTAIEYFKRALAIQEQMNPSSLDAILSLQNLGSAAEQLGDLDSAIGYFEKALEVEEQLPLNGGTESASTISALARVTYLSGDTAAATGYRNRLLAIQKKTEPNSSKSALLLTSLADQAYRRKDLTTAMEYLQQVLEIRRRLTPGSSLERHTQRSLGTIAIESGNLEEATGYLLAALTIQRKLVPNSPIEAQILKRLGSVLHQTGQLEESLESYTRSLEILESQISKLGGTERTKASFRARHGEGYRGALEVLLQLNRPEEALGILERSRARSFLTLLRERDLHFGADVPEELDQARSRLAVLHDRTLRQMEALNPEQDSEQLEALTKRLRTLQLEYEENAERIKRSSPRLAALQYPEPLNLNGIQQALDPGTLMLSFSVGKEQINVFAVSQSGDLQVKAIPFSETQLQDKVDSLLKLIEGSKRPETDRGAAQLEKLQRLGQHLYEKLISPVEDLVGQSERLLILPDGPLHRLPFGALVRPLARKDAGTERDWQYLIEWKPLHEALSATVFAELKKSRPPASSRLEETPIQISAFGDPTYPNSSGELDDMAGINAARARSAFRGCGFKHQALPHTRREIKEISALYPNSRAYLGEEATEEAAKGLGLDTDILHLAAHGCVDDNFPLNSAVVLSMPEGFPEDRDNGLLQVWEIFERVRLNADLVVLSACQSGLGQELRGEGLIGLTRAFQYAGARTVAATLWKVDDQVTAELMVRFYRHLKSGKTKDDALRAAQVELIREPITIESLNGRGAQKNASAPYYWAAFQLYGDWL